MVITSSLSHYCCCCCSCSCCRWRGGRLVQSWHDSPPRADRRGFSQVKSTKINDEPKRTRWWWIRIFSLPPPLAHLFASVTFDYFFFNFSILFVLILRRFRSQRRRLRRLARTLAACSRVCSLVMIVSWKISDLPSGPKIFHALPPSSVHSFCIVNIRVAFYTCLWDSVPFPIYGVVFFF